jgi:hypothetical protein
VKDRRPSINLTPGLHHTFLSTLQKIKCVVFLV